jgi:hypothetical protein
VSSPAAVKTPPRGLPTSLHAMDATRRVSTTLKRTVPKGSAPSLMGPAWPPVLQVFRMLAIWAASVSMSPGRTHVLVAQRAPTLRLSCVGRLAQLWLASLLVLSVGRSAPLVCTAVFMGLSALPSRLPVPKSRILLTSVRFLWLSKATTSKMSLT